MAEASSRLTADILSGGNAAFLDGLWEDWLEDPARVAEPWRSAFASLDGAAAVAAHRPVRQALAEHGRVPRQAPACNPAAEHELRQFHVLSLINAYRFLGVQHARLDPLGRQERPYLHDLDPDHYGFSTADMAGSFQIPTGIAGQRRATLGEILAILRDSYCGSIGAEFMYLSDSAQKSWIQERLERHRGRPHLTDSDRRRLLERLTAAETLEHYLHARYVGQKRFSLEGAESLIPCLDFLIHGAAGLGVPELVIGMAHRGRLNVLVNILGKSPADLYQEFEGGARPGAGSGDVKYHQGFSSDLPTAAGPIHVALAFNPSHLELVYPVVEGSVRARQQRRGDLNGRQVVPVVIHGDAAFSGQGVVMETLNMSQTRGFATGGTVHIVVNNQIGFTLSDPRDSRSSLYCTDVVKMVEAPVFHVNGDDPEAVVFVTRLAVEYRMTFGRDVVIDLVCYRRLGHNEQDEPSVTQPRMYQQIARIPAVRQQYRDRLVNAGQMAPELADGLVESCRRGLERGESGVPTLSTDHQSRHGTDWSSFLGGHWRSPAPTAVPMDQLQALGQTLVTAPTGFRVHPRLARILESRRRMLTGDQALDWGMAENLAYASLLVQGHAVRISGQDSGRGTFFHRHAVWHHQERESWQDGSWLPLQHLAAEQAHFLVIDSLLSEEAVLAFEYGYSTAQPHELVIWEAQFGDFADGAQAVIDRFIVSGERKWGRLCGLTLFLPHGYEGQGPEHSSARIERFLSMCAEDNIQVCIPTLPGQFFHLLRRQVLRPWRKPLIVFTPKSLLRHRASTSRLNELVAGGFQPLLVDPREPAGCRRLLLCSGRIYFDLAAHRREHGHDDVAILRLEQLHPLPEVELRAELARWTHAAEWLWVQEEPENMGAWWYVERQLRPLLAPGRTLGHIAPPAAASPAVGHAFRHLEQQHAIMESAFAPS